MAALLATAVAVAGCTQAASHESAAIEPLGAGLPDVARSGETGAAAAALNAEQAYFLEQAVQFKVRECMRAEHWTYIPTVGGSPDDLVDPYPAADVIRDGFPFSPEQTRRRPHDPNGDYLATVEPDTATRWRDAFFGSTDSQVGVTLPDGSTVVVNSGGCLANGQKAVYGSLAGMLSAEQIRRILLGDGVRHEMLGNPAYKALASSWRACMESHGFVVSEPADSGADLALRAYKELDRPSAVDRSRAIGLADAECQEESGIGAQRPKLRADASRRLAERYGLNIDAVVAFQRASLERARAIVASTGPGSASGATTEPAG